MERTQSAPNDPGQMSVTRRVVDAIEMNAQNAGTGAGNMMIVMIMFELVSLAIEATEATAVDTAVVDTTDLTIVLAQASLTPMICSMVRVKRTHTWRTESGSRITR